MKYCSGNGQTKAETTETRLLFFCQVKICKFFIKQLCCLCWMPECGILFFLNETDAIISFRIKECNALLVEVYNDSTIKAAIKI